MGSGLPCAGFMVTPICADLGEQGRKLDIKLAMTCPIHGEETTAHADNIFDEPHLVRHGSMDWFQAFGHKQTPCMALRAISIPMVVSFISAFSRSMDSVPGSAVV